MNAQPRLFSISGFLKLTRTWNLVIVAFTQIMTALFVLDASVSQVLTLDFMLLLFSTGCVAAAGYIINDYYDVKIDFINKPDRVVVGRTLKRRSAMMLHLTLGLVAVGIGWYLGWRIMLFHVFSTVMLWLYSNQLKRMPFWGNLVIGFLSGAVLIIVAVYFDSYPWPIYVYSGFAFIFTVWREIIKDIEDREGDEEFGCRTLPIVWGVSKTKQFIYVLMVGFTVSLWVANLGDLNLVKMGYMCVIMAMELTLAILLYRADTVKHFALLSSLSKWIIVLGVLSMVFSNLIEW